MGKDSPQNHVFGDSTFRKKRKAKGKPLSAKERAQRRDAAVKTGEYATTALAQALPPCKPAVCPNGGTGTCNVKSAVEAQGAGLSACLVSLGQHDVMQKYLAAIQTGDLSGLAELAATSMAGQLALAHGELSVLLQEGLVVQVPVVGRNAEGELEVVAERPIENPRAPPCLLLLPPARRHRHQHALRQDLRHRQHGVDRQVIPSDHLFAELVVTALAVERQLRPYVGELGGNPMVLRAFGRWQEVPHPSRFVRDRSEVGDHVGELYTRMVDTDTTMACLWEKRVKAVLSLPRAIRAADSSPAAEETALFVRTALSQIPLRVVPISNTLEAILKGVAINEVCGSESPEAPSPAPGCPSISSTAPCGVLAGPSPTKPSTSSTTASASSPRQHRP